MRYRLMPDGGVIDNEASMMIPEDPGNVDWQEYLGWLAAGNEPAPAIAPQHPVPDVVSKLGLKRALEELGMWADIRAAIASNPPVQEEWDLAVEIRRNDPMTQFVIALNQFSEQQVDALIVRAHELVRPAPAQP